MRDCFVSIQAYWPSLVMKKWLNIKPKEYEFSEDDFDTETESEDDGVFLLQFVLQITWSLLLRLLHLSWII